MAAKFSTPNALKAAPKALKAAPASAAAQANPGMTPVLQKTEDANAAPMTPKTFRNHPDMENFFRFIYENDLRLEALHIVDEIILTRAARKKKPLTANA